MEVVCHGSHGSHALTTLKSPCDNKYNLAVTLVTVVTEKLDFAKIQQKLERYKGVIEK